MIIGILKEPAGEKRVAMLPAQITPVLQWGVEIMVESSDIIIGFWGIDETELKLAKKGVVFIGVMQPLFNYHQMKLLSVLGCTAFSLDMIPFRLTPLGIVL